MDDEHEFSEFIGALKPGTRLVPLPQARAASESWHMSDSPPVGDWAARDAPTCGGAYGDDDPINVFGISGLCRYCSYKRRRRRIEQEPGSRCYAPHGCIGLAGTAQPCWGGSKWLWNIKYPHYDYQWNMPGTSFVPSSHARATSEEKHASDTSPVAGWAARAARLCDGVCGDDDLHEGVGFPCPCRHSQSNGGGVE